MSKRKLKGLDSDSGESDIGLDLGDFETVDPGAVLDLGKVKNVKIDPDTDMGIDGLFDGDEVDTDLGIEMGGHETELDLNRTKRKKDLDVDLSDGPDLSLIMRD